MTRPQMLMLMIPLAYILGSVPFGLIVGKMRGIDVRTAGSGNIGATNVGRLLGKKFFFLVFFLDLLKSAVPMAVASAIVDGIALRDRDRTIYLLWLLTGFAAVLGHMFSMFLKFKGGKGVATSAGMMLGLFPYYTIPGLIAIVVFVVAFLLTRIISVSSMVAAVAFPPLFFLVGKRKDWPMMQEQLPLFVFAILIALLIVWKHRTNISRLMNGTEARYAPKS